MKHTRLRDYADRAPDWRHRAEKLRALARATPQPNARAELLDLAVQWERLAEQVEARRASGAHH